MDDNKNIGGYWHSKCIKSVLRQTYTIFTLCSVMSVFVVAVRYKEKNAVIQKISQNTLGIYLIHVIVLRFMERILPVSLMTHLGVSVLYIAVIMMLSLGITEIIHRIPIVHRIL